MALPSPGGACSQRWCRSCDYHVEIEGHYYSVPYQLVGWPVEVRLAALTVEVFHRGQRGASPGRSHEPYRQTTVHEHRPKSHQRHLEWTPSRLIDWAQTVGPSTARVFRKILHAKPHPEMGYRSCWGILRLSKTYSAERVEAAATRASALRRLFESKPQVDAGPGTRPPAARRIAAREENRC